MSQSNKNGFGDDGIDDYVDDFAGVGGLDAPSESDLPEDIAEDEAAGGVDAIEDEIYDEKFGNSSSIADSIPRSSKSIKNKGRVDISRSYHNNKGKDSPKESSIMDDEDYEFWLSNKDQNKY